MDIAADLSKKITFLLPIKGREQVTKKVIGYLNEINYKLNIIVADGSLESQEKLFIKLKDRHYITYKKFPFDETSFLFTSKLYQSSRMINTEYCALMENDELINFENYIFLLDYLEKNKRFSFVTGKIINFNKIGDNKIEFHEKQCHVNFNELLKSDFALNKTYSCWEGLHRTKNFKITFENIFKCSDINFDILSLIKFINIFTLIQGDAKFFQDKFISFRQANTLIFDNEEKLSASAIMKKNNQIKVLQFIRSLKYIYQMYKIAIKYLDKNKKNIFLIYYTKHLLNIFKQDIYKYTCKGYNYFKNKLVKKKSIVNHKKDYFKLKNIDINGYDFFPFLLFRLIMLFLVIA